MNSARPPLPADAEAEIAGLLYILNETGQRLEQLTGGEVDAVTDRSGRTLLLRGVQEQLRQAEASRQAAILNALPASIAMLDQRGMIVAVNGAWGRFGLTNAAPGPGHAKGLNYLEVCDQARGAHCDEAGAAAAGIRAVLDGKAGDFSLDYPCHSPTEQRWFQMTVSPLPGEPPAGAVVMHLDITVQKLAHEKQRETAQLLDNIVENIPSAVQVKSVRDGFRIRMWNKAAELMYGVPRLDAIGRNVHDLWPAADADRMQAADQDVTGTGRAQDFPDRLAQTRHRGDIRVHMRKVALYDEHGKATHLLVVADDRTEQLAAEARLRESESRFRSLTMLSSDWFWEQDEEHRFVRFSGGEGVMGWGPDQKDAVGKHRWDLAGVIPISSSWEEHKALLNAHQPFRKFEYQRILGDGRLQFVEASGEPIFDAAGRFSGYRGVATEITRRKQNEHDLQRFRAAMDSSGDGIVLVDRASMRYVDVNKTLCDMVGYTRDELIGMTPMELFGVDRATLERDYDALIEDSNSSASVVEGRYRHRDGTSIPVETRRRAMLADGGWIIVGSARDITERTRAAGRLRESERRMTDLLGNIELIAIMLDRDARLTYCNEHFLRLTGWRREEALGRDWFADFMPPALGDGRSRFQALLANLPEAWHGEHEILLKSGEARLIRWDNSVLRSAAGDVIGTASIGADVTEQKQAGLKIERLNRVTTVLSQINAAIVRARDRADLFAETCRIAVSEGGYVIARVVEVDADRKAALVATSELDSVTFQEVLAGHNANPDAAANLLGLVIRDGVPKISNDVASDTRMPNRAALTRDGNFAVAVLPIVLEKRVAAVIILRSRQTNAFSKDEMHLLLELVSNLTFALDLMQKRERLDYLAYYDPLTGLANRSLFLERVAQYMRGAAAGGQKLALFLVDLERFRNINDSLGRPAGDALLQLVATWLARDLKDSNLIARLGADQFAIVLPELRDEGSAANLLEKKIRAFANHPFHINDTEYRIAARVGVALFPNDGVDADTLLKNAEAALKRAKHSGEKYLFYKQKMTATLAGNLTLENQLRRALERKEFVLHYQPKVNLASGLVVAAEALIRWNDPQTGLVPPGRFIPVLEETGLIHEVGRWALDKALEDYLRWRDAGLAAVRIAVNVSPLQLRNRAFNAEIEKAISLDAHAAAGLELEITESLIMEDVNQSITKLQAMRALGISIAIDDFGTGFSSLSYLAKLPVDTLKIDRSFITSMTSGSQGLSLVSTIISLAHSLNLKVVAEGVETEEQSRLLRLLRCDEMQGFLFSKPLPAGLFETRYLAAPVPLTDAR
jgi:diguanylate cyclase (GGDEF)-like protein/PAS domain S-box-containing protein